MRHRLFILAVAVLVPVVGISSLSAQRHGDRAAPPTVQRTPPPAPPAPIVPVSSGLGAIQFVQVNYGVPAPQALTRQLQFDDDRTRAAALSAIGAPGQYLQRGHIPMPRSVDLVLAPFSTSDELDALLTVELDQHLVTAVLVPVDGNWRRIATLTFATPFENPANTPTTWVRTARSMMEKDRFRAVFHGLSGSAEGNFTENEAHLRIANNRAVIVLSFESTVRACAAPQAAAGKTTEKSAEKAPARTGCGVTHRWFQTDPSDPAHKFELVTGSGHLSLKDADDPLADSRTMLLAHLRAFSCQPYTFSEAAQRYEPTANAGPCPAK